MFLFLFLFFSFCSLDPVGLLVAVRGGVADLKDISYYLYFVHSQFQPILSLR